MPSETGKDLHKKGVFSLEGFEQFPLSLTKFIIMVKVHPQYIIDAEGKKIAVVLPLKEFESLIEELEEIKDVMLYDKAKEEDTGERISFSEYVKKRKKKDAALYRKDIYS
jgi:hypothetical protein